MAAESPVTQLQTGWHRLMHELAVVVPGRVSTGYALIKLIRNRQSWH